MGTIEEKFEEWIGGEFGMTDGMAKDYIAIGFKKGYELAQKEMEDRLKDAESVIHEAFDFNSHQAQYEAREYFKKWKQDELD